VTSKQTYKRVYPTWEWFMWLALGAACGFAATVGAVAVWEANR